MAYLVTILGALLAINLPILAYAWLYMYVPNLIAAVPYFGLSIFLCLMSGQIVGRMRSKEPEQGFGCLAVVTFVPGIFVGLFLVVPVMQLRFFQPALDVEVMKASDYPSTQFYSFKDPILAGPLSYWHRERRSRRSGGNTEHYQKSFQVLPVVGPGWSKEKAPLVWLTSESEDRAFGEKPSKPEELSGLKLIKPDNGFHRAVTEACKKSGIPAPENPIFLERTLGLEQERQSREKRLVKWLVPYNFLLLLLALFSTRPRKASKESHDD